MLAHVQDIVDYLLNLKSLALALSDCDLSVPREASVLKLP